MHALRFPRQLGILFVFLLITLFSATICMADGTPDAAGSPGNPQGFENSARQKEWDVKVGLGMRVGPRYEGGGEYTLSPVPYFNIAWRDIVNLGLGGLNLNLLRGRDYKFGAGITYNPGRDEKGSSFFGTSLSGTDERLRGLGDIDPALGFRAFGAYMLGPLALNASITKYIGDQNDGVLVNFGVSLPWHPMNKLTLTPNIVATWADDKYMQTFFGVTQFQSSRSGLAAFNAESGIKDVTLGLNATYLVDRHWFVSSDAGVKQLEGDADRSPITESGTSATFGTVVGYHF